MLEFWFKRNLEQQSLVQEICWVKLWLETAMYITAGTGLFTWLFLFAEDCFMQSMLCLSSRLTLKFEIDGHSMISPEQVFFAMNLLYKLLGSLKLTNVITLAFNVFAQISCPKTLPLNLSSRRKWCSCHHRCWLFVLHTMILLCSAICLWYVTTNSVSQHHIQRSLPKARGHSCFTFLYKGCSEMSKLAFLPHKGLYVCNVAVYCYRLLSNTLM